MNMEISIPKFKNVIKLLLWLTKFFKERNAIVVCKGYGGDWDYYTGLCWCEDSGNIDFNSYDDFKLWLNF